LGDFSHRFIANF
jgi:hypothetical protein